MEKQHILVVCFGFNHARLNQWLFLNLGKPATTISRRIGLRHDECFYFKPDIIKLGHVKNRIYLEFKKKKRLRSIVIARYLTKKSKTIISNHLVQVPICFWNRKPLYCLSWKFRNTKRLIVKL